ncbi:MAG TPA: VWA domain-containing protein, partial [Chitinophagaceae bacterium]|nr:VWA domain-containing protein [Chitinophagaceae bacterium]
SREKSQTVLNELFHEFPPCEEWFYNMINALKTKKSSDEEVAFWLYGKFMNDQMRNISADQQKQPLKTAFPETRDTAQTIVRARAVEEIISLQVDLKQQEDYVMTHNFEKVDTAEEFSGSWRDFDGSDELKDHEQGLNELKMRYTVRSDETTHSVYQSELTDGLSGKEFSDSNHEEACLYYPEWDYAKRRYKPDHCKVFVQHLYEKNPTYTEVTLSKYRSVLLQLRKMLSHLYQKRQWTTRQFDGEELDIDAVADWYVDLRTHQSPELKVYRNKQKKAADLSILLLLDSSLSTDAYAAGNRILDVEKQVSILFGEILNENHIDFAIQSFCSHTRNHTAYTTLKSFDEDWLSSRDRIGALQPRAYTRIGAAIRHSASLLKQRVSKNKWLILLSDGKPNDFDPYEGRYGVEDIQQALRELHQNQIQSYALAIESEAKYYLPKMFGENHYQILHDPVSLIGSMAKLYDKIRR